jgi:type IV fimbrial biogenesis protein FimT
MKNITAFTLLELLLTISIIGLLLSIAIPSYQNIINCTHADATLLQLYKAVQLARSEAIKRRCFVTLCPTKDYIHCINDRNWNIGYMIFIDPNENGIPFNKNQIIKQFMPITKEAKLLWKGFRSDNILQMTPLGFTNYQNGTFTYCPKSLDTHFKNTLVITQSGRVRFAYDNKNNLC